MTELQHIKQRLVSIYQTRGLWGFIKFITHRIIRTSQDLVFENHYSGQTQRQHIEPTTGRVITIDKNSIDAPDTLNIVSQVLASENSIYRAGLEQDDQLFIIVDDTDMVLHYSFVQFQSRYKRILGETMSVPMFTNCWTSTQARGKRLYPTTLRLACQKLSEEGHNRTIITCHPDNIASIKGIEHAGFQLTAHISSLLVLSRIAIQKIKSGTAKQQIRVCKL